MFRVEKKKSEEKNLFLIEEFFNDDVLLQSCLFQIFRIYHFDVINVKKKKFFRCRK